MDIGYLEHYIIKKDIGDLEHYIIKNRNENPGLPRGGLEPASQSSPPRLKPYLLAPS